MARREDFDVFIDKFKPIERPNEEGSYMYETYGEEYEMVKKHIKEFGDKYVFTIIDVGKLYITPGWHYVNRFGYVLTTIPFNEKTRDYLY